jgi:tetratricopeptide (TPR) repeat protein
VALGQPTARADAMQAFKDVLDKWPTAPEATQASAGIVRLTASTMDETELENWYAQNLPGAAGWSVALQLSRKYFLANRFADALKPALKVLADRPTADFTAQAAYLAGASQQKQNNAEEAIPYYRQAIDAMPADDLLRLAQRGLVQCYLDTKRYATALDVAKALTQKPIGTIEQQAENLMYLAEAYLNTGQKLDARTTYQKVVTDYATSTLVPNALLSIGWIAEDAQAPDRALAVETYSKLIAGFKDTRPELMPNAYFRLGINQAELRNDTEAISAFKQVPETDPLADQAWYGIAWAYRDAGQHDQANAQFKALAERFPQSPLATDSLYRIGEYWFKQENYAVAVPFLKNAYELSAPDAKLRATFAYKYAQAAYYIGQYPVAAVAFATAADDATFEASAEARFWQAVCLDKVGTVDAAQSARVAYLQYVEKYPKGDRILDAALGAGRAALTAKMPVAAREDLKKCMAMTVDLAILNISADIKKRADEVGAEAQFDLAQSYYDEGTNYVEAHRQFAAVSAFNYEPWYSRSLLMMAKCSVAMKEPLKAENTLKRLVSLFPADHPTVIEALKYAKDNGLDVTVKP